MTTESNEMTFEKATGIAKGFVLTSDKDLLVKDLAEHFLAKGFLQGFERGVQKERERCAEIADRQVVFYQGHAGDYDVGAFATAETIRNQILAAYQSARQEGK